MKKTFDEKRHANPIYLNYYLFEGANFNNEFKILKKNVLNTILGNIEIAIIAESHYLKLENTFAEILSCSEKKITSDYTLLKFRKSPSKMQFYYNFPHLVYSIKIRNIEFPNLLEFLDEETRIYKENNFLFHFFGDKTALTSINIIENSRDKFILSTFHTYPKYKSIIYSTTQLDFNL